MEGALGADIGKMGYGVIRYSQNPIACVIDSTKAGKKVSEVVKLPRDCPVVSTVEEAHQLGAEVFLLGTAPPGGRVPDEWRPAINTAINLGMSVINGLHEALEPQFSNLNPGQWVWDVRQEPKNLKPATGKSFFLENKRILMVGTDMAVGKMTAGLELQKAAKAAGIDAGFLATGQIGITITGRGVPLDAVRVDYASGSIEQEMERLSNYEWVIVEGQGSLVHPGSTATLPLMRGSMPTHMILCMQHGQTHLRRVPDIEIPPVLSLISIYESLASMFGINGNPQVVGIAVNTAHLPEEVAQRELIDLRSLTGISVTDPVRFGSEDLVKAIQ
jgi:uncharacterized NAD-dependent epimerase/dehydratase family protein